MSTITCCPHCKGTHGFTYDMWVLNHMVGFWGEEAESGDSTTTTSSLAKCLDCGAKLTHWKAEGKPNPSKVQL